MSDYLTIEEMKAEISKHLKQPSMSPYCQGAHDAIKACLRKLDRLEPPDAKLRRVREEVESMMAPHIQLGVGVASHPMVHKGHLLEIIDSHLTTSEVDEELEEVRKKFPVGRKVEYGDRTFTITSVTRDNSGDIRIGDQTSIPFWYSSEMRLIPLETEAEKLRKELQELKELYEESVKQSELKKERIAKAQAELDRLKIEFNNAVRNLGE